MKPILLLLSVIFLISCSSAETPVITATNELYPENFPFDGHVELLVDRLQGFPNGTEVAVGLIRDGKSYFYGVERVNDTLVFKENRHAIFEIGSISKVFTSTLLAGYVVDGEVALDDNINDYLPFSLKDNTPITFVSLSNHSSGLPRMPSNFMWSSLLNPRNPYVDYQEEELTEYLTEKMKLHYDPGTSSRYSNVGVALLAFTLEKHTGKDYQSMLSDEIFSKYGMNESTTIRADIEDALVPGRDDKGRVTSNWDLGIMAGAGGILSSVSDLSKFAYAQFDTTNLELNLTRELTYHDSVSLDMGLGWFIKDNGTDNPWYWHNGGTGGYSSSMGVSTLNENAIIILSNVSSDHDDARKIDQLCNALMKDINSTKIESL